MTQEDKQLLLKDLSARLSYHPVLHIDIEGNYEDEYLYGFRENGGKFIINDAYYIEEVKPYLRPMSSMNDEEIKEFTSIHENVFVAGKNIYTAILGIDSINWLLEHHFDFMGLIPKGLAIEVTENNNPYENNN